MMTLGLQGVHKWCAVSLAILLKVYIILCTKPSLGKRGVVVHAADLG